MAPVHHSCEQNRVANLALPYIKAEFAIVFARRTRDLIGLTQFYTQVFAERVEEGLRHFAS